MSDALTYLVKARGDALGHYFKFLKETGKHLDPKTRDLISVITKVHAQTENGFKQYVTRALRDGCTPMEILDAILMAFPALGLAKTVWAAEQILALDLPEFSPDAMNGVADWHDLGAMVEFKDGETARIDRDGRGLFIYRSGDTFKVYDSRCPHQVTNIPHLALHGEQITCPKHEWKFDVTSGECIEKGDHPLKAFETRVDAGQLQAYW